MAYNSVTKLRNNIEAIRLALEWDRHSHFSSQDAAKLKLYSGFGGLKGILYGEGTIDDWKKAGASETDLKLHEHFQELFKMLKWNLTGKEYKEVIDSVNNSILTAFYTPEVLPETFYRILKEFHEVHYLYEPSAGAGVFMSEADVLSPKIMKAVEKDTLTGRVLMAIASTYEYPTSVTIQGFEKCGSDKLEGRYDLIVSNIPYGAFPVYDPQITDRNLTAKIHNYFFAKGLTKIGEGGILAYLVSSAFLDTVSNRSAREYLFSRADFISLTVMPDNLMKEIANTEAPSHFLVVRKNTAKAGVLSDEEKMLVESHFVNIDGVKLAMNDFIYQNEGDCRIGDPQIGKDQYGKPAREIHWNDDIRKIGTKFASILLRDFENRYADPAVDEAYAAALHDFQNIGKRMDALTEQEDLIEKEYEQTVEAEAKAQEEQIEEDEMTEAFLNEDTSVIIRDFFEQREQEDVTPDEEDLAAELFPINSVHFKPGVIVCKKIGKKDLFEDATELVTVMSIEDGQLTLGVPDLKTDREKEMMKAYIKVRDAYYSIESFENRFADHAILRAKLKGAYDEFVELYGRMNKTRNKNIILKDPYGFVLLASVELKSGNEYLPADVLTRSNKGEDEALKTDNAIDALSYCLGTYGRVDMTFISEITDKEEEELVLELGDLIYVNPDTMQWETADKYLSGNVYRKMLIAKHEYEKNGLQYPQLQRSFQAITEVQPEKIPFELLDFNLGERWIPIEYYTRFAQWVFESDVRVVYFPSTDNFKVSIVGSYNAQVFREYYVRSKGRVTLQAHDLLEHALENTAPYLTYTVGDETVPDNDAIQLANDKIETIRTKFLEWLNELPIYDKNILVDNYNNTYNCYVLRKYDGRHLRFPDLNMDSLKKMDINITEIREAQKDATWRIIQDTGGIMDWEVGSGKTLIMVLAAYEMKRMGIRRKPCILALKANVADIVRTFRAAYPHARVLAPNESDFEKKNRSRLFHEMKNNDWDCIIMTHDQFGKIEQSFDIQREIIEQEISNLDLDLQSLDGAGWQISRTMRKGLESRKATMNVKMQAMADKIATGKDKDIDFEEMGIDHLFVDEAHKFKNLTFTTRHDRVAGLGNTTGSNKALNMLFAIRTLQKRFNSDLQTTFLSGTPISNSLTEMYLLFKYLRPRELARQNILNFDAWAAVFAKKTTDFEFSVTNQIIAKERFRHFIKVPELALFYNEIADYRTNKAINIDKPEMDEQLVAIPPTDDQRAFIRDLIMFAKTGDGDYIGRGKLTQSEDKARMLIATNYAKKMSVDMRLINSEIYGDHVNNKISVCCRNVVEFYNKFNADKGVQLIFCDVGTPKSNEWNVYDAIKEKLVVEHGLPAEEIVFIHDYNERTRFKLFQQIRDGIVRVLLGSTDKAGTGLNVQDRVVALHDLDIPWKPAELEQRGGRGARQGNWLAKLMQNNIVHRFIYAVEQSLDTYKFTLLKNKQTFISQMKKNELQVRSIDEGSFDEATGMNFAEYVAILSGDTTLLEKAKIDKKLAVLENLRTAHYRQQSDNKRILSHKEERLFNVDEIIHNLKRDKDLYDGQLTRDATGVKENPIEIFALKEILEELDKQRAEAKAEKERQKELKRLEKEKNKDKHIGEDTDVPESEPVEEEIVNKKGEKIKDSAVVIGEYLVDAFKNWRPRAGETSAKLGRLYGFDVCIERMVNQNSENLMARSNTSNEIIFFNQIYTQHPDGGLKYKFNHGAPSRENPKLAARNPLNAIDRVGSLYGDYTTEQKALVYDIEALKAVENKPFARDEEIKSLHVESKKLEKEISDKIKASKEPEKETEQV